MDLRAMLNNDAPPKSSSSSASPARPPPPPPAQGHRPQQPPPPLSPFTPPGVGRYGPPQPSQPPYQTQGYPFPPPPPSPQHTQGYTQSPISTPRGTPHPLSAHSTAHSSGTPTSTVSPSSHGRFPSTGSAHHYSAPGPQRPLHSPPPPSPHSHYSPHQQDHPGYPRPSPLASPVESRSFAGNEKNTPLLSNPIPRDRPGQHSRDRDRDVSISPKTKIPYPSDDDVPVLKRDNYSGDMGGGGVGLGGMGRPPPSPLQQPPVQQPSSPDYSRRGSGIVGRNNEMMDVENGIPLVKRGWSSPMSDRAKLNGSGGSEIRDSQVQGHHAPAQPHSTNNNSLGVQGSVSQRISPPPKETQQPQPLPPTPSHTRPGVPPSPASRQTRASSSPKPHQPLAPPPLTHSNYPSSMEGHNNSSGPPRKRARKDEPPPIWARKASRSSSSSPVMAARRGPASSQPLGHPSIQNHQPPPPPPPQPTVPAPQQTARPSSPPPPTINPLQPGQKILPGFGPWEDTIIGTEPYEEMSRQVADFLFLNVVSQNDPALVNPGPDRPVIEIEAKIGHLIDKNTNDRIRLPVRSETVFNNDDPSWRIQFRSSMTETQHKHLNEFLNQAVRKSAPPPNPPADGASGRIRINYVHTRERDTFYELPSDKYHILPPSIRATLNPRHRLRVRVTTDQKTGKVLKKIVKARIADMNVYSPRTAFDWRVSVNMEMPYVGDHEGLHPLGGGTGGGDGDRNKDRLSYRHLVYQIDLTQVTDATSKKEHELEVEVDGKEIRRQGLFAREKKPNGYEQLVKGFVDNVRVLIRAIDPREG